MERDMRVAELRPYARGMIAVNKSLSNNEADVTPIEILPQLAGELNANTEVSKHKGIDADGNTYEVEVTNGTTLRCKWLPCGSNRTTAPDVRRGERVLIYKYADADIYYWTELGLDDHLRRLETVIYRFSNIPDGLSDDELTDENCYFISISTHMGMIEIATSKSNGEEYEYKIQLNTKESIFLITDNIENYIQLESAENRITIENADKTKVMLEKRNLFLFAPDNIYIESGKNTEFTVGADLLYKVKGKVFRKVGGDYTNQIDGNYNTKASNAAYNIGTFTIDGKLVTTGTSSFGGAMSANGITSTKPISGPSHTI